MSPHDADDVTRRSPGHIGVSRDFEGEPRELDLLRVVSHEFRTPLTILLAGVDVLRQQTDLAPELGRVLDAMTRASRRLDRLVTQASAAVEQGERRVAVRLGHVLEDVGDRLEAPQRERLAVDVDEGVRNHVVAGEATLRVLEALVDNALKFSAPDGRVVLDAGVEGQEIVVRVRDEGPGMDEGFAQTAFEAFRQHDMRTIREHSGLGLGLFTARRWAGEAGGRLAFEATDDGTIAALHLPLHLDLTDANGDVDATGA